MTVERDALKAQRDATAPAASAVDSATPAARVAPLREPSQALQAQEDRGPVQYYGSYAGDRFGGGIGDRVGLDELRSRPLPGTCLQRVALFEETHANLAAWSSEGNWKEATRVHKKAYFTRFNNPLQEEAVERVRQHYVSQCATGYEAKHLVQAALFRCDDDQAFKKQLEQAKVTTIPAIAFGKMDEKNERCIVDFANKRLGGGWLSYGQVQEEIMFTERFDAGALCAKALMEMPEDPTDPEKRAVACKFSMHANEAWIIKGCPRFAHLDWYGRVREGFMDKLTPLNPNEDQDTCPTVICVDAIKADFQRYEKEHLEMMLRKAYCGFAAAAHDPDVGGEKLVATGSWGCGAFHNNECVMFVVQALAANAAGVALTHHVLGDGRRLAPALALLEELMLMKPQATVFQGLELLEKRCASDEDWRTKFDPSKKKWAGGVPAQTTPKV